MPEAADQNPPKPKRGADTRREILEVARRAFGDKGYDRTSMAQIAAQVGVVEGALYKHFPGKRELLLEATHAYLAPRFDATREALGAIRGTRNRLRFVIWRHLREFIDDPGVCRLVIQEIRASDDFIDSAVRRLLRGQTDLLVEILDTAAQAGELREGVQAPVVRDVVFGGIEHLAFRVLRGRGTIDADALADQLTDLILVGTGAKANVEDADADVERLRRQVDRLTSIVDTLQQQLPGQ